MDGSSVSYLFLILVGDGFHIMTTYRQIPGAQKLAQCKSRCQGIGCRNAKVEIGTGLVESEIDSHTLALCVQLGHDLAIGSAIVAIECKGNCVFRLDRYWRSWNGNGFWRSKIPTSVSRH